MHMYAILMASARHARRIHTVPFFHVGVTCRICRKRGYAHYPDYFSSVSYSGKVTRLQKHSVYGKPSLPCSCLQQFLIVCQAGIKR